MSLSGSSWKWTPGGKGIGRLGVIIGLALLIGIVLLRYLDPPPVQLLRHQVFDLYQRLDPVAIDGVPVVIVDIDEASLSAIGQWPWPRPVIAQILQNLASAGAVVIGFDVIFAEPDRVSPPVLADDIVGIDDAVRDYLRGLPDNDAAFAEMIAATRTVLAQGGSLNADALEGRPPPKRAAIAEIGGDPRVSVFQYQGITRNLPVLENAAQGLSVINLAEEGDGIARRIPLVLNIGGTIVPTLSVEMLRLATGQSTIGIRSDEAGINSVVVGGVPIPTDKNGRAWVRFAPPFSVPYVSAKDVLDGAADPAMIAGRFVLIGTSAVGLLDIKKTPVAGSMPGVEVHAHFLANVLQQNLLARPNFLIAVEFSVMIVAAAIILMLIPRLSAIATLLFGGGIMIVLVGVSWFLYTAQNILFDLTATAIATFSIYAVLTYLKYVREEADKKMVRRTFSQYLAPAVVDRLAQDPEQLKLGGENREMTILFSDIRGFTSIAERTNAEQLTALINRILTPLTEAILDHGGTVDKYIGDCVMAFWNAPLDDPDHARHGCLAGLEMMRRIDALNQTLVQETVEGGDGAETPSEIRIGIGLNSGVCCVGNFGSDQRFDYSVLGDAVNLSSRLEGQTSFYGCPIVIGETTAAAVQDLAIVRIDRIKVVGRQQPVDIFALVGDGDDADKPAFQRLRERHDELIDAYLGQHWSTVRARIAQCRNLADDLGLAFGRLYDIYEERVASFLDAPPDDAWDGVYVAQSKK